MTHLIIGLGNPPEYDNTRHNAGQILVSRFIEGLKELARPISAPGFAGEAFRAAMQEEDVILAPRLGTYMNNSGPAMQTIMNFFKIPLESLVVVHDDVALPLGQLRLSHDASAAGHNGVKSIISVFGTQEFTRLRLGIESRQGLRVLPTDNFVLEKFADSEKDLVDAMMQRGSEALSMLITDGLEKAMAKFNE